MKTILLSVVLTLMGSLASIAGVPGDAVVAHLNRIVIPRIEFDRASVEEAIDFLRSRCADVDPDPDPARRGISILTKRPGQADQNTTTDPGIPANPGSIKITYSGKSVPLVVALSEIARQAHLDIYLTESGIVICQMGDPPFPNGKAEKGEVWKTIYKSKSAPAQPRRDEKESAPHDR